MDFYGAPEIDRWLAQFEMEALKQRFRFKCLLFRGSSECGKSRKAASLFGVENTLVVTRKGWPPPFPAFGPSRGANMWLFFGTRSSLSRC